MAAHTYEQHRKQKHWLCQRDVDSIQRGELEQSKYF